MNHSDNTGFRALLAVLLSMIILFGSQYLYLKYFQQADEKRTQELQQSDVKERGSPVANVPLTVTASDEKRDSKYREVLVENDVFKVTLTNQGGTIKSVLLKKYRDNNGNPIVLSSKEINPLSITTEGKFEFSNIYFDYETSNLDFKESQEATVTFKFRNETSEFRRTFTFSKADYAIDVKEEVTGIKHYFVSLGKDFGIFDKDNADHWGPVILKEAERIEITPAKVKETQTFREGVKWVACEDKYFFSAIVPLSKFNQIILSPHDGNVIPFISFQEGQNTYKLFVGPKEYDYLKKFKLGLEHIVDFGFFSILARPLFWFLKLLYSVTHNYGLAIIILTIIVRIPFIPIVNRGQKSMQKLSELQPKLMKIREQYKDDPQRMQKEMMELYRKYKVNPMSGCLPILLQIPVFFALYKILTVAIELRQAPFMLWIKDLSVKDPYYVLPILMGATMIIQQKMTPSTMDANQQKIMLLMSVLFTFLFLTFPSGLVLYWLVNNIFGIAQQFYINQKLKKSK